MNEKTIKVIAWATCALAALTLLIDAHKTPESTFKSITPSTFQTVAYIKTPVVSTPVTACAAALNLALSVGWPAKETPTLLRVLKRESRCSAQALNPKDTVGRSYGLMQINSFWCTPSSYWPKGWLQTKRILTVCDELLDPKVNLVAGLAIWQNSTWAPWNLPK